MFGVKVESRLDTVIGSETEVKGDVTIRGGLRLDGRVEGNISVTETLYTGKGSQVRGDVHCRDAVLCGRIDGNVTAQGTLEVHAGATVIGDVRCRNLVLDREAFLEGRVSMSEVPA